MAAAFGAGLVACATGLDPPNFHIRVPLLAVIWSEVPFRMLATTLTSPPPGTRYDDSVATGPPSELASSLRSRRSGRAAPCSVSTEGVASGRGILDCTGSSG